MTPDSAEHVPQPGQPRLHVLTQDDQPEAGHHRVAFLHGLFGQGRNWNTIARRLSDRYAVSLIDLPNHGRSDWTTTLSYPEQADQVADVLSRIGGQDPWTVVGHSMGGKIAMMLALRHPALLQRLCVVDIAPVSYPGQRDFAVYIEAMRSLDLDTLPSREAADRQLAAAVPSASVRAFLLQNLRRDGTGWRWQMNLALLGDHLDTLGGWPEPDAAPYPGPTLWIAGAESDYVRTEYEPIMRGWFPQLRTVRVKGAGHWVHSEQPDTFGQVLEKFLP